MIFCARIVSPSPRAIEHSGAPPVPKRLVKAVMIVMIGKVRPSPVSARLDEGLSPLDLLRQVLSDFALEVLETAPVEYRCYCSEERVSRALISMGREELTSLIEEQGGAELTCQFCDRVYRFSRADLERLLAEAGGK